MELTTTSNSMQYPLFVSNASTQWISYPNIAISAVTTGNYTVNLDASAVPASSVTSGYYYNYTYPANYPISQLYYTTNEIRRANGLAALEELDVVEPAKKQLKVEEIEVVTPKKRKIVLD